MGNVKEISRLIQGLEEKPFPEKVAPMLATLTHTVFDSDEWLTEIKWDGYRAIGSVNNGMANLYSRTLNAYGKAYDPILNALSKLSYNAVFDGEMVVFDQNGRHDFQLMRNYSKSKKGRLRYYIYDLLYYDKYNLFTLPLIDRKQILKEILPDMPELIISDHIQGNAAYVFSHIAKEGLEGIILKKADSRYEPGKRSPDWLKAKVRKTTDAVVIGYTNPKHTPLFGSLVLGIYDGNELTYFGHAINVPEEEKESMMIRMKPLETRNQPLKEVPADVIKRGVQWLKPDLVCEVKYNQITINGKLRQTTYLGFREDKPAADVQRETEIG